MNVFRMLRSANAAFSPFLGHSYHLGAALPGREAPGQEMAITRKLPILIRPGSSDSHRATALSA
jgi:hypothetical protein